MTRDGDVYVIRRRKCFTSGAASDRCKRIVFTGVSDDARGTSGTP